MEHGAEHGVRLTYYERLSDPRLLKQLRALLEEEDDSFVPPLSCRQNSTQHQLSPAAIEKGSIDAYFESLLEQSFILATDGDVLAAFLSFRRDFNCPEAQSSRCAYVSTIIVDKRYRGLRLTYDLYAELFGIACTSGMPIVTRTWSGNDTHLHILNELGFELIHRLNDDRGKGIDTVYLKKTFNVDRYSLFHRLKAYRIFGTLLASAILTILAVVFALLFVSLQGKNSVVGELSLAFATSLLVSALCLLIDSISKYRSMKNDRYLSDMKSFGIEQLNFDKQTFLIDKIGKAHSRIWISGYRHILTSSVAAKLQQAAERGAAVRIVSSPPWMPGFQQVYGNDLTVLNNYIKTFRLLLLSNSTEKHQFRFTSKPLFNDICLIDDCLVTSPFTYASNDRCHTDAKPPTAREFFTLVVTHESRLQRAALNEYEYLWESSEQQLDTALFLKKFSDTSYVSMSDEDKLKKLQSCLIDLPEPSQAT